MSCNYTKCRICLHSRTTPHLSGHGSIVTDNLPWDGMPSVPGVLDCDHSFSGYSLSVGVSEMRDNNSRKFHVFHIHIVVHLHPSSARFSIIQKFCREFESFRIIHVSFHAIFSCHKIKCGRQHLVQLQHFIWQNTNKCLLCFNEQRQLLVDSDEGRGLDVDLELGQNVLLHAERLLELGAAVRLHDDLPFAQRGVRRELQVRRIDAWKQQNEHESVWHFWRAKFEDFLLFFCFFPPTKLNKRGREPFKKDHPVFSGRLLLMRVEVKKKLEKYSPFFSSLPSACEITLPFGSWTRTSIFPLYGTRSGWTTTTRYCTEIVVLHEKDYEDALLFRESKG